MSDRIDTSREPNSSRSKRALDDAARSQLQALAHALGRQAARLMWAEAMRGDDAVASVDSDTPKAPRRQSGGHHGAR
jgi:hypothetical protein